MSKIKCRRSIREDRRSSVSPNRSGSEELFEGNDSSSQSEESAPESPESSLVLSKSASKECLRHQPPTYQPESAIQWLPECQTQIPVNSHSNGIVRWPIIIVLLVLALAIYVMWLNSENGKRCSYDGLHEQYPNQPKSDWHSLTSGIENVKNKRSKGPAVYLLMHQGAEIPNLVHDIVERTSNCVDGVKKPAVMNSSDFTTGETGDYGNAIVNYKEKIADRHVVLIENLHEIPGEAGRALHTICDTHSPIARHVVIFLTLMTPQSSGGKPMEVAERRLNDLWGKLKSNELDPLITRVTDQVILLRN